MKRLTATTVLCLLLFSAAFVTGKGPSAAPEYPDSLRSVWLYTEGVKQNAIAGDSVRARELFLEAIRNDSTYAPAYYELAANGMYATPDEAVELARKAFRLDTTNKWYHQFYGQALIYAGRYDEALKVYRRLQTENPKDPDNYRILAALYEQKQSPVMALVTLDSAELRFGRIPVLSATHPNRPRRAFWPLRCGSWALIMYSTPISAPTSPSWKRAASSSSALRTGMCIPGRCLPPAVPVGCGS